MDKKSVEIMKIISDALKQHPEIGIPTEVIYDPENFMPIVGVLEKSEDGKVAKRFHIKIEDHKQDLSNLKD
jgi:hypothetical protein